VRENPVKSKLAQGGTSLGTMVFEFNTTGIGRIIAAAGAEFVIYDTEHTGWGIETVRMLMATSRSADIVPLVRVPASQYHLLANPLDAGAMGLMIPMVESEEQAQLIARSVKYPPDGRRGAAFGVAHDDYGLEPGTAIEKMARANREVLIIAQIETAPGVENVEAIAAVPGIDILWIGHNDLTNSMGIPGQFTHPDYIAAVERVLAACRANNKPAGIMSGSVADARAALAQGFRIVAYNGDLWIYGQALGEGLKAIRG
jgi:2-dehydro-3-deoxyglucarate aldolase/4-hydroxy-2-oxoheptanedioate aldolase